MKKYKLLIIVIFSITSPYLCSASSCSVSSDSIDFGNYQPFSNSSLDSYNNIYLNCHNSTFVEIRLSTGNSGSYSSRSLISGSNILSYNLYSNNRRTTIWGDGTGGSQVVYKLVRKNKQSVVKAYGRIPSSQSIPPGIYTDNIIVTVSY